MKFGNKLSKLRKEHNLSQEQLADKLEVSRQAVSKWESGQSYPDMDKIVILCKIFDCTIDELINDEKEVISEKNKKSLMSYVDEFLNFITKTVNMFWSMSFKQKMSCIFQMSVLVLILVAIFAIIGSIIASCFSGMYSILPYRFESFIRSIFLFVYVLICLIIGAIITVHVFKIRFLDYFVTVEDNLATEKEIEKPVEENEVYKECKKEKIIIRDPKHSTFSLVRILSKLLNIFLKGCALLVLLFLAFSFVFIIFALIVSLYYIKDGMIFVGIMIAFLGSALICFTVGELLYRFIFNIKQHFKITFVMAVASLVVIGIGFGLSFVSYTTFERVNFNESNISLNDKTRKIIHVTDDNILIGCSYNHYCSKIEYEVNDDLKDVIIVDVKHNSEYNYYIGDAFGYYDDSELFRFYDVYPGSSYDFFEAYNEVINDLKNKVIRDYSYYPPCELKITSSTDNIEMLKNNYNKFNGE